MKYKVLVSNIMMLKEKERFESLLNEKGYEAVFPEVNQFMTGAELINCAGEYDAFLAGDDQITEAVLKAHLPRLKGISKWGTGLDSIDLNAAKALGVPVLNSIGAFKDAVAEVAIAYMLDLGRRISFVDRSVRQGSWVKPCGEGITNKTVGVIGYGAIGQGIGLRANGMLMNVLAFDPMADKLEKNITHEVSFVSMDELLKKSDFVCLACNASEENANLIDSKALKLMKSDSFLVNVSRGSLVDEIALISALEQGEVAGCALDVYKVEPLPLSSKLIEMENVVLGSHNANNLFSATEYVHLNTLNNLDSILSK